MNTKQSFLKYILIGAFLYTCSHNLYAQTTYKSIKIGTQVWMAENLNVNTFRNGDKIEEPKTNDEWTKLGTAGKPICADYNNDTANGKIYGKYYSYAAVNDKRGIAPKGWHVPTDTDWAILKRFLGDSVAGVKLKSKFVWEKKGTDNFGFNALPVGYHSSNGGFGNFGEYTSYWSSTSPYVYSISNDYNGLAYVYAYGEGLCPGFSIRCIKDK